MILWVEAKGSMLSCFFATTYFFFIKLATLVYDAVSISILVSSNVQTAKPG